MITRSNLHQLNPWLWEIPQSFREDMRAPARLYSRADLLDAVLADQSIGQLVNVTALPGVHPYALAMPDMHQGYGFPIGGVAPIRVSDGVISPGGVGYDINCGVRLLTGPFHVDEIREHLEHLATAFQRDIPSGVGRGGELVLSEREMTQVLTEGVRWALRRGLAREEDLEVIEEGGAYSHADAGAVSAEAKQRGAAQLGTIGSGNHFVEIQCVDQILDPRSAGVFGLFEGQVVVMIHTGSRGLGHQTCTDYVRLMNERSGAWDFTLPDRELSCAPFRAEEGQQYFRAMAAAANFAWTNRQVITWHLREGWRRVLRVTDRQDLRLLYDVSHNIAKLEEHGGTEYIVHRKGATRAFGPHSAEIPERYRETGQPVLIPGSMGTHSFVLAGTAEGMRDCFGSCCHGAGRALSRMKARKTIDYNRLTRELEAYGVIVRAASTRGLLEEAPQAYKDVTSVVDVVEHSRIARTVARLRPLAVIKG